MCGFSFYYSQKDLTAVAQMMLMPSTGFHHLEYNSESLECLQALTDWGQAPSLISFHLLPLVFFLIYRSCQSSKAPNLLPPQGLCTCRCLRHALSADLPILLLYSRFSSNGISPKMFALNQLFKAAQNHCLSWGSLSKTWFKRANMYREVGMFLKS